MVQQQPIQNQNLPLQQFPNVISPENARPLPDQTVFFQGMQGEVTPSPQRQQPAPAPAQAQAQIPPALQRPQAPPPAQAQPNARRNLMDAFDDDDDEMEGGRIMKRNARMTFYKVR
jgi:hypothetical protein